MDVITPPVAVALGRVIYKTLGLPLQGGHGMPAAPWHAFASGAVAAWFVWADYSGVNFQVPYAMCAVFVVFAVCAGVYQLEPSPNLCAPCVPMPVAVAVVVCVFVCVCH